MVRLKIVANRFLMIWPETFPRIVRRLSGEGYKILLDLFASRQTFALCRSAAVVIVKK